MIGEKKTKGSIYIASEFVSLVQNSTGYFWEKLIFAITDEFDDLIVVTPGDAKNNTITFDEKVSMIYISANKYDKKKLLSRLLGQLKLIFRFCKIFIGRLKKVDLLLTGTNPILMLPYIAVIKKFKKFKWIILVHDVFPENLIPAKLSKENSLKFKFLYKLYTYAYASADKSMML